MALRTFILGMVLFYGGVTVSLVALLGWIATASLDYRRGLRVNEVKRALDDVARHR